MRFSSFKEYYKSFVLVRESLYFDVNTKKFVFDTSEEAKKVKDYIVLIKPIFAYGKVTGDQTRELLSHSLHRKDSDIFYGYDVINIDKSADERVKQFSNVELKDVKNRIYAAVKGVANIIKGKPYEKLEKMDPSKKVPLEVVQYNELVNKAVEAFVEKTPKTYDLIIYLQSRSEHVKDLGEKIYSALKAKSKVSDLCEVIELKKRQISDTAQLDTSIEQMFDLQEFGNDFFNAINSVYKDVEDLSPLKTEIISDAMGVLKNVLVNKFKVKMTGGGGLSIASDVRPINNNDLATQILKKLAENQYTYYPEILQKLGNNKLSVHGRFMDYQKSSHYDFPSIINALTNIKNKVGGGEILVVDDNMNSGDTFKQVKLMMNEMYSALGGTKLFNWNYFILIKDETYSNPRVERQKTPEEIEAENKQKEEAAKKIAREAERQARQKLFIKNPSADINDYKYVNGEYVKR